MSGMKNYLVKHGEREFEKEVEKERLKVHLNIQLLMMLILDFQKYTLTLIYIDRVRIKNLLSTLDSQLNVTP